MMSSELLSAVRAIVPPLVHASHKGLAGRVGVIGGSLEYTGAPYFAAISAMRAGADLVHVFCPEEAAQVIKSYSPELIVHPLLSTKMPESEVCSSITAWFPRLHSVVIGPGLGRDPKTLSAVKSLINTAKEQEKDIIIDADGLFLITNEPEIICGYKKAILTPNAIEFSRLYERMFGEKLQPNSDSIGSETRQLAAKMGNITVLRKGQIDSISDGNQVLTQSQKDAQKVVIRPITFDGEDHNEMKQAAVSGCTVIECQEVGCPRRCGGQGDLLSGTIGLFAIWARQAERNLSTCHQLPPLMVASFGGCCLVKKCAEVAFGKHHRAMLAGDMVQEIGSVFDSEFEQTTV